MNLDERLAHLKKTLDGMSAAEFDDFMHSCGAKKEDTSEYTIEFTINSYCGKEEFTVFPALNSDSDHYRSVVLRQGNGGVVVGRSKRLAGAI